MKLATGKIYTMYELITPSVQGNYETMAAAVRELSEQIKEFGADPAECKVVEISYDEYGNTKNERQIF